MTANSVGNASVFPVLLQDARALAYQSLDIYFDNPTQLDLAFGSNYNQTVASQLFSAFSQGDFSGIPEIKILSDEVLGATNGAYSASKNEIYLNERFLSENVGDTQAIASVILEEIGHYIDAQINTTDSAGDEGDIFARLVQGETLNSEVLANLKAEDDSKTIVLGGEAVEIEQNTYTGTYSGDNLIGGSEDDQIYGDPIEAATIFQHSNYGGTPQALYITIGDVSALYDVGERGYPLHQLHSDDQLSSLRVSSGIRVTLYEHAGFQGATRSYTSDSSYVGNDFNDKTSSIKVEHISDSNDYLDGGAGNDRIFGRRGNDTLIGGPGDDFLNGGTENDILYGWGGNDTLIGADGNDFLNGGTENDTLFGWDGNDTLEGNEGNDFFWSDSGYDVLNGGDGNDTFDLSERTEGYEVRLNGNNEGSSYSLYSNGNRWNLEESLYSIENVIGSNFNDQLYGDGNNNRLEGNGGNDTLIGGVGNDTLIGGDGNDTFDLSERTEGYEVRLNGNNEGSSYSLYSNGNRWNLEESLYSIENVIGSNFNDKLYGDGNNNRLEGNGGNDTLIGGNGNDTYSFDADTQLGTDTIYENSTVALKTAHNRYIRAGNSNESWNVNQQTVIGSWEQFEVITQNNNKVALKTAHNRYLTARDSSGNWEVDQQTFIGSWEQFEVITQNNDQVALKTAHNRYIRAGIGGESWNVNQQTSIGDFEKFTVQSLNSNTDTLDFSQTTTQSITIDLSQSGVQQVNGNLSLILNSPLGVSIESVMGGSQGDRLTGNSLNNLLNGNGGNDTLIGGSGNDILTGGSGNDRFVFNTVSEGIDRITDFTRSSDKIQIDRAGFGATSTSQFSYNSSNGALSFNNQQFATLDNLPTGFNVNTDIVLV